MAVITRDPVSSDRFTWIPEERTLTIEASSLPRSVFPQRVYDDACDEGLAVRSTRTGRVVSFAVTKVVGPHGDDAEGGIMQWELTPIREHQSRLLGDVKMVIFND